MRIPQDLRLALRTLLKTPAATIVAIASLALGIGANTAIFTLMNALVLRSLPIREPAQLVRITIGDDQDLSLPMYRQLRQDQRVFADLFAATGGGIVNLEANGARYAGGIATVSGEYFSSLGVQPILGRSITPADLALDSGTPAAVAVLDYACWQRRYQGDPAILGKTIRVEDRLHTIVGVSPPNFSGLIIESAPDVTVPIGYSGRSNWRDADRLGLEVYARLNPGVTLDQARAQIEAIWPAVRLASLPGNFTGARRDAFLKRGIAVTSAATGNSFLRRRFLRPIYVLMGMVGLLLLIACVNLANLMLARAAGRRQEFGIRLALGAARWRLIRQMLAESLTLSAAGAALGVAVAWWSSRFLVAFMWRGFGPSALSVTPDLRVLAFTAILATLTGILFGLAPAWRALRADPLASLQRSTRSVHTGTGLFGRLLIVSQVALSLVLVLGAVLFIRSVEKLRTVDAGYRRDGILLVQLFPRTGAESQILADRIPYFHDLAQRLGALPGVEAVTYVHMGPGIEYKQPVTIPSGQSAPVQAAFEAVGPGFFHLSGMRLLAGRDFSWRDGGTAPNLAIVSESLARRLFPSESPIGKTIDFGTNKGLEIVGVVNSASLWVPGSREPMAVYLDLMQMPAYNSSRIHLRTAGDPNALAPAVRQVLDSLGRHIVLRAETLEHRIDAAIVTDRMIALLSTFFGGVALLLSAIGLYALMSYAVASRTAEIGIRVALGARTAHVHGLVLKEVVALVAAGMAIGIPAALAASRLVAGMVFDVAAEDPLVIGVASLLLLAVALVAGYLPARRAARIDPMTALRAE